MVSQRVGARRALLFDLACASCVALLAIALAAGIGVVGFFALIVVLLLGLWVGIEAALRRLARARRRGHRAP